MEEGNIAVLVDAKTEYTKQLVNILRPCIYQGIKSIYEDAKDICDQDNSPNNVLMTFQDLLSRIPKWSQDIIDKEYNRIVDTSKCDWIEDLITAVFISHTKVLTIVHQGRRNRKVNLKIPKSSHFMHLCYIESAREFWKNPYLFSERVTQFEYQRNIRDSEGIISDAVNETIRKQLPVKHILKEYLGEGYQSEAEDDEDIKTPITDKQRRNLKKLVQKELERNNSPDENDDTTIRQMIREEITAISPPKGGSKEPQNTDNTNAQEITKTNVEDEVEVEVEEPTITTTTEEPTITTEEPATTTEEPATTTEEPAITTTEEPTTTTTEEPATTTEEPATTTEEPATTTEEPTTTTTTQEPATTTTEDTAITTEDNVDLVIKEKNNVESNSVESNSVESDNVESDNTNDSNRIDNMTSDELLDLLDDNIPRERSNSVSSMSSVSSLSSNDGEFKIKEIDDLDLDLDDLSNDELSDIDLDEVSETNNVVLKNNDKQFKFYS